MNEALNIAPYEYGDDVLAEPNEFCITRTIDEQGLVKASIDVPTSYSSRIRTVTGGHLAHMIERKEAIETVPNLLQLIAVLGDDVDFDNYFNPTDGNIRHLSATLLDWVFQHPDGYFRLVG